ncbi:type IV pilus biogenesis protein PilM [Halomonas huangheensis]|uniref:SHS2 domain-containing protein n=1 Tax=Halomonas huangheensis TaxID=1178482 RepID=W1N3X7_9GAMM|nr:pilus assembly protein PilM [Halomonas huangheensis]ALM51398.1 hypothetical protein AR456_03135 [Halomonas huangheensis]ERL49846.1 hypothetical protein BJB45_01615 [Halomonas huangheensis]
MHFTSSAKGLVGVDITSTTVRCIELKAWRSTWRVGGHAIEPLPPGAVVGRCIQQPAAVAAVLSRAVAHLGPHSYRAAVAVPVSAVTIARLSLPATFNDADIAARLEWDSDKYFAVPFTEMAIDFHHLGIDESNASYQNIELVACHERWINQWVGLLQDVGLEPVAVDCESLALHRVLRFCYPGPGGTDLMLIDLRAELIAIYVWRDGVLGYSRDFPGEEYRQQEESVDIPGSEQLAYRVLSCLGLCGSVCDTSRLHHLVVSGDVPEDSRTLRTLLEQAGFAEVCFADPLATLLGSSSTHQRDPSSHCSSLQESSQQGSSQQGSPQQHSAALLVACGLAMWGQR